MIGYISILFSLNHIEIVLVAQKTTKDHTYVTYTFFGGAGVIFKHMMLERVASLILKLEWY